MIVECGNTQERKEIKMEFKEVVKIRSRMCDYYKNCDGCPFDGAYPSSCVDMVLGVKDVGKYERILKKWEKEHTVMTNADKFIEVMKNTFDGTKFDKDKVHQRMCLNLVGKEIDSNKCASMCCLECMKWWDEEYKEPEKEKEE